MTTHKPLSNSTKTSEFQQAIEVVEALEPEAQAILIDIIAKRLKQQRREELVQAVKEAEAEFARGEFRSGSVADLLAEIDNCQD